MGNRELPKETYVLDGIIVTVIGDTVEARNFFLEAKNLLLKVQLENTAGLPQYWKTTELVGGGSIHVSSIHGIRNAYIFIPPVQAKQKIILPQLKYLAARVIVLYLRVDTGILLCKAVGNYKDLTFEGKYRYWNPYERSIGMNYLYAPYAVPETDENSIYPYLPQEPVTLENDEELLEWRINGSWYVVPGMPVAQDPKKVLSVEVVEPKYYDKQWSPAYWENYTTFYTAVIDADWDLSLLPTTTFGIVGDWRSLESSSTGWVVMASYAFGWGILPLMGDIKTNLISWTREYYITYNGSTIVSSTKSYRMHSQTDDNGAADWHTGLYPTIPSPYYWWEDYAGPVSSTAFAGEWETHIQESRNGSIITLLDGVSDINGAWGIIYLEATEAYYSNVTVDPEWYSTPSGTPKRNINDSNQTLTYRVIYKDYLGTEAVVMEGDGTGDTVGGKVKLYTVDDHYVFLFGCDENWSDSTVRKIGGVAVEGKVTMTSLRNITATDKQYWEYLYGVQEFGIVECTGELETIKKFIEIPLISK